MVNRNLIDGKFEITQLMCNSFKHYLRLESWRNAKDNRTVENLILVVLKFVISNKECNRNEFLEEILGRYRRRPCMTKKLLFKTILKFCLTPSNTDLAIIFKMALARSRKAPRIVPYT